MGSRDAGATAHLQGSGVHEALRQKESDGLLRSPDPDLVAEDLSSFLIFPLAKTPGGNQEMERPIVASYTGTPLRPPLP